MYQNYNKQDDWSNGFIFHINQNKQNQSILHCLRFLTAGKCTMSSIVEMVHLHKSTRDFRLRKLLQSHISNPMKAYNTIFGSNAHHCPAFQKL